MPSRVLAGSCAPARAARVRCVATLNAAGHTGTLSYTITLMTRGPEVGGRSRPYRDDATRQVVLCAKHDAETLRVGVLNRVPNRDKLS